MPRSKKQPRAEQLVLTFLEDQPEHPDRKPLLEERRQLEQLWWSKQVGTWQKGCAGPFAKTRG
jgi:hypothetical protein